MIHAENEKAWFTKSRAPHLGGRVIIVHGPVTCLQVVLAVPMPSTGIATDRRSSVILLHVKVYRFSSPVHLRCRVRACLSLREAIGL